ncbi:MAG: hypothetical protein ACJASV_001206 [Pseudorhodobacter sp.]|jgi:hypothetical protein
MWTGAEQQIFSVDTELIDPNLVCLCKWATLPVAQAHKQKGRI